MSTLTSSGPTAVKEGRADCGQSCYIFSIEMKVPLLIVVVSLFIFTVGHKHFHPFDLQTT